MMSKEVLSIYFFNLRLFKACRQRDVTRVLEFIYLSQVQIIFESRHFGFVEWF